MRASLSPSFALAALLWCLPVHAAGTGQPEPKKEKGCDAPAADEDQPFPAFSTKERKLDGDQLQAQVFDDVRTGKADPGVLKLMGRRAAFFVKRHHYKLAMLAKVVSVVALRSKLDPRLNELVRKKIFLNQENGSFGWAQDLSYRWVEELYRRVMYNLATGRFGELGDQVTYAFRDGVEIFTSQRYAATEPEFDDLLLRTYAVPYTRVRTGEGFVWKQPSTDAEINTLMVIKGGDLKAPSFHGPPTHPVLIFPKLGPPLSRAWEGHLKRTIMSGFGLTLDVLTGFAAAQLISLVDPQRATPPDPGELSATGQTTMAGHAVNWWSEYQSIQNWTAREEMATALGVPTGLFGYTSFARIFQLGYGKQVTAWIGDKEETWVANKQLPGPALFFAHAAVHTVLQSMTGWLRKSLLEDAQLSGLYTRYDGQWHHVYARPKGRTERLLELAILGGDRVLLTEREYQRDKKAFLLGPDVAPQPTAWDRFRQVSGWLFNHGLSYWAYRTAQSMDGTGGFLATTAYYALQAMGQSILRHAAAQGLRRMCAAYTAPSEKRLGQMMHKFCADPGDGIPGFKHIAMVDGRYRYLLRQSVPAKKE